MDLSIAAATSQAVEWLYDKVFDGDAPGRPMTEAEIDRVVRRACGAAGAAGFVTGLGGVVTLPITLPANLIGVTAVHLLLIKRIAAARGYDVEDQRVRGMVTACLIGNTTLNVMREAGVRWGMRGGRAALGKVAASGSRLAARRATSHLGRMVPLAGGLVGGVIDAAATRAVAGVAKRVFPRLAPEPQAPGPAPRPPALPAPALPAPDRAAA